jgi:hypothetical protein
VVFIDLLRHPEHRVGGAAEGDSIRA